MGGVAYLGFAYGFEDFALYDVFHLVAERFRYLNVGLFGGVGLRLKIAKDDCSRAAQRSSGVGAAPRGRREGRRRRERKRRKRKRGKGRLAGDGG